jgi:nicotinate-nucleotide adenylyltransferase
MPKKSNLIAIIGGSFDPVHYGHLYLAQYLQTHWAFQAIYFVPCKQPVSDKLLRATGRQRCDMLRVGITHYGDPSGVLLHKCLISLHELQRETPSYTLDTLIDFRKAFPTHSLIFVMGSDVFVDLDQWDNWQALLQYAHLMVVKRPLAKDARDCSPLLQQFNQQHQAAHFESLQENLAGIIYHATIQAPCISSTQIRQLLAQGKRPTNLTLPEVLDYIQQKQLYFTS